MMSGAVNALFYNARVVDYQNFFLILALSSSCSTCCLPRRY